MFIQWTFSLIQVIIESNFKVIQRIAMCQKAKQFHNLNKKSKFVKLWEQSAIPKPPPLQITP